MTKLASDDQHICSPSSASLDLLKKSQKSSNAPEMPGLDDVGQVQLMAKGKEWKAE